jgi:hypothetical protein
MLNFQPLPSVVQDMQCFGCRVGLYTFVITLERRNIKGWKGWTASWRMDGASGPANKIEGRWRHRVGAEVACQNVLRQLRSKQ